VNFILQALTSLGISTILLAIVQYILNRKKLGADASKVITEAATALVDSTQKRLKELEDFKAERDSYDNQLRARLARHEMWDHRVYSALLKLDPDATIESPPSLYITNPHLPPDSGGEFVSLEAKDFTNPLTKDNSAKSE
jgi:hypothetical protein